MSCLSETGDDRALQDSTTSLVVQSTMLRLLHENGVWQALDTLFALTCTVKNSANYMIVKRASELMVKKIKRRPWIASTLALLEEEKCEAEVTSICLRITKERKVLLNQANWNRIVQFVSFSTSTIIYHCKWVEGVHSASIARLCKWTCETIETNIGEWLRHHPWEEFVHGKKVTFAEYKEVLIFHTATPPRLLRTVQLNEPTYKDENNRGWNEIAKSIASAGILLLIAVIVYFM